MTVIDSDQASRDGPDGHYDPATCASRSVANAVSRLMSEAAELALTGEDVHAARLLPAVYSLICSANADPDAKNYLLEHRAVRSQRAKLTNADFISVALALIFRPKGRVERSEHKKFECILRRAAGLDVSFDDFERWLPELEAEISNDVQPHFNNVAAAVGSDEINATATTARFRVVCVLPDRCEFVFTDAISDSVAAAIIAGTIRDEDYRAAVRAFYSAATRHTTIGFIFDG